MGVQFRCALSMYFLGLRSTRGESFRVLLSSCTVLKLALGPGGLRYLRLALSRGGSEGQCCENEKGVSLGTKHMLVVMGPKPSTV